MEDKHEKGHVFVRYDNSMTACIPCPARNRSRKTKIFGIGPNAVVRMFPSDQDGIGKEGKVVEYANFGQSNNGGVMVDWSGTISKHKVGANGRVELMMVEPFPLGAVYCDHLPLGDLSCEKPSYINIGDRVQVNINTDSFKQLNKEFGGWNDEMEKIVGEIGVVKKLENDRIFVAFEVTGRPWLIYRQACKKVSIVLKGDVIKVIEDVNQIQRMQNNHGGWLEEMKILRGKLGKVCDVDKEGTLYVKFPGLGEYLLSPSCCVKQYNPPDLKFDEEEDVGASRSEESGGATASVSENKCGMVFDIGIRVVRGQNWSWGDQDGGEGSLGTVVEIGHDESSGKVPPKCAQIQWDKGYRNMYRIGYEGQYDLRIYDTSALGIKHDLQCTEPDCEEPEIYGMLWQCDQCPNVRLCSKCYHNDKHDIIHKFTRFDYGGHQGCSVPKRQLSSRQKLDGIFEDAQVTRGIDWRWENQDGGEGSVGQVLSIVNFSLDTDHDGVEVVWDSGHTNVYRLGYKGCVDVKAVKSSPGGFYYKDHLPIFKLPDQPKPGPSQTAREGGAAAVPPEEEDRLKKGDTVKIGVDLDTLQTILKESKNWNERIIECIGMNGTVVLVNGQQISVDFSGRKWTLHEMALIKIEQYVKDQVVQVQNDANEVGRLQNGHGPWNDDMKMFLGKKGLVVSVDLDGDVTVSFGIQNIKFNPECLKPSRGSPDEFKEEPKPQTGEDSNRAVPQREDPGFSASQRDTQSVTERSVPPPHEDSSSKETSSFERQSPIPERVITPPPQKPILIISSDEPSQMELEDISGLKEKFKAALKNGKSKEVLELLQMAPKLVECTFENGNTPLTLTCDQDTCNLDVVEAMLKCKAEINVKAAPPLLTAVRKGHRDVVQLLLNSGADANITNNNGQTAVHIAVQMKNKDILKVLQDKCNFNISDKLGDSPVSDAITVGDPDIREIVFHWPKISLEFENKLGFSPIHLAARKGDIEAVQQILRKCPKAANKQKSDGYTALHLAACMDHDEIAKVLLQNKAKTGKQTENEGQTPLHIAAVYGSYKTARCLVEDGKANVNAPDENGNNALHLCLMGKPAVMEFAKMQKAENGQRDSSSEKQKLEIATLLIKHNIQTELRNNEGKTPLEEATSQSLKEKVENLIQEKLNPSVRPKVWKCDVCEEEDAMMQIKPCNCRLCEDCIPKKLKKCPQCNEQATSKVQIRSS
ncbi:E3 ubiquitin-protein ligase MIB2-like isoform X2 [Ostrea edulis]|uniref:E3 ubiquitin-protein ligase MIB2-like isoform X2 n=1 Tax=Ostrea edulis TaxID=37623 RepID=UPI0024AED562|nr:E3 ubiquitin-protein ligase MIB2-like isoform X2 [Ostrea edulis]XP_056012218.1 E3 ubiquitin-protein ligase MIB2-like isoform X2 [Ostrea edulis]